MKDSFEKGVSGSPGETHENFHLGHEQKLDVNFVLLSNLRLY
jgi:hypothetical protein